MGNPSFIQDAASPQPYEKWTAYSGVSCVIFNNNHLFVISDRNDKTIRFSLVCSGSPSPNSLHNSPRRFLYTFLCLKCVVSLLFKRGFLTLLPYYCLYDGSI